MPPRRLSPTTTRARQLRRAQTDAERRLWLPLQRRQLLDVKFRRQQPIGPYFVDFCSLAPKLIIELDGGQHARQLDTDAKRTEYLERCGYHVLRFWNNDVLQHTDAVTAEIAAAVEQLRTR